MCHLMPERKISNGNFYCIHLYSSIFQIVSRSTGSDKCSQWPANTWSYAIVPTPRTLIIKVSVLMKLKKVIKSQEHFFFPKHTLKKLEKRFLFNTSLHILQGLQIIQPGMFWKDASGSLKNPYHFKSISIYFKFH